MGACAGVQAVSVTLSFNLLLLLLLSVLVTIKSVVVASVLAAAGDHTDIFHQSSSPLRIIFLQ